MFLAENLAEKKSSLSGKPGRDMGDSAGLTFPVSLLYCNEHHTEGKTMLSQQNTLDQHLILRLADADM